MVAILFAAGCGSKSSGGTTPNNSYGANQDEQGAWSALCRLTKYTKFFKTPADKRAAHIRKAVRVKVRNAKVLAALLPTKTATLPDVASLRASAKAAGITSCPLVDYLARDQQRQRCASTGDAELCYQVGEMYARQHIYPGEERSQAPAHFERACTNGSTKACARRAAWSGGAVRWLERACRRGHKRSCERLAVDSPAAPKATLVSVSPTADAVVDKVKKVYLSSVVDCFETYLQARTTVTTGKIAFTFRVSAKGVADVRTNAFDEDVATCLKQQISRWAFRGSASAQRYRFCYELRGKSMLSRRRVFPNVLAAVAHGKRRRSASRFGSSRLLKRVAKPVARRSKWASVSVYYGRRVGARTTLSKYTLNRALKSRLFYMARCFQRHIMKPHIPYTSSAYAYVSLTVGTAGRLTKVKVDRVNRYHSNKKWQRCIESSLRRVKIPPPKSVPGKRPTTASFTNVRLSFSTSTYRRHKAQICDFEGF